MTTPQPLPPSQASPSGSILRELLGLALIVLGAATIVVGGWWFDVRLGVALLGVAGLVSGVVMTRSEV